MLIPLLFQFLIFFFKCHKLTDTLQTCCMLVVQNRVVSGEMYGHIWPCVVDTHGSKESGGEPGGQWGPTAQFCPSVSEQVDLALVMMCFFSSKQILIAVSICCKLYFKSLKNPNGLKKDLLMFVCVSNLSYIISLRCHFPSSSYQQSEINVHTQAVKLHGSLFVFTGLFTDFGHGVCDCVFFCQHFGARTKLKALFSSAMVLLLK